MIALKPIATSLTLFAALSMPVADAKAADLPSGYTCSDLRTKVAEYGQKLILAAARSRGFSEKDIAHIRGKCGV